MFEFSIKSSKDIKELNIIFEDGTCSVIDSGNTKEHKTSKSAKESESKELPKEVKKSEEFLSFDDIEYSKGANAAKNLIVPKPEIPEASINVAEELHNLDF